MLNDGNLGSNILHRLPSHLVHHFAVPEEFCWLSFHHGCTGAERVLHVPNSITAISKSFLCFACYPIDTLMGSKSK